MDSQKRTEAYHKSRLGQILVKKGYLTPETLDNVIADQAEEPVRLGEILVKRKLLSKWQLRRALSSQTRMRFAASVSVIILDEIQRILDKQTGQNILSPIEGLLADQLFDRGSAIQYDPVEAKADMSVDGTFRLKQPSSVGEFQLTGLRLLIAPGEGYENLQLSDVDFSRAQLSLRVIHQNINDKRHLGGAFCVADQN